MLDPYPRDSHGELEMVCERRMGSGLTSRRLKGALPQHNKHPELKPCRWAAPQHRQ